MRFADKKFVSNPGSPFHTIWAPRADKNGNIRLEKSGVENTDEIIQSYAESCDIHVIVQRIQNGETDLLNRRIGQYGDFTQMPTSLAGMLQMQIDSNRLYDSLPSDVREKFDNDRNQFFATSGTEEWYKKIEPVLPENIKKMIFPDADIKIPVSEVKTEE